MSRWRYGIVDFLRLIGQVSTEPDQHHSHSQAVRLRASSMKSHRTAADILRVDQGPELTALAMLQWAAEHNIRLRFSDLGKPT